MYWRLLFVFLVLPICGISQIISTFAGNGTNSNTGDGGLAISAGIYNPLGSFFDYQGNFYISSRGGHKIRRIDNGGIINTVAGTGVLGYNGDGGLADTSKLQQPMGIVMDSLGNIFIADLLNNRIRKVEILTGIISTIAGTGIAGYNGDNILASTAQLNSPNHLCFDRSWNLYISDQDNFRIRKISPGGIISTVAGNGIAGNTGDGGLAIDAQIFLPMSITTDSIGDLYIADFSGASNCIRKVDIITGLISTYAGTGQGAYNGDNILAVSANISPVDIEFDKFWNLFISDRGNARVRRVDRQTGVITTIAGNGIAGFSGDGGLAINAKLNFITGIAFDSCNNLFINEGNQGRIRKVTFNDTCGQTSTSTITSKSQEFSIYPNPANTHITVTGENLQSITITNTLGQIVHQQKATQGKTVVDVSSLNAGVYFVTVTNKQGVKVTKKVVKE